MSLDLESAARVELLTCFITHLFVFSCFYLPHFNALLVVSFYALIDNVCYIFFVPSRLCVFVRRRICAAVHTYNPTQVLLEFGGALIFYYVILIPLILTQCRHIPQRQHTH